MEVSNISLGRNAGCAINTGSYNILFGDCAGKQITTGRHNVVMGKDAMSSGGGQGADCNVTLGYAAGCLISFGSRNILLGACAGKTTSSGANNIAIGYNVELPSATGDCQLAIGNDTNRWIVGDSSFNVTLAGIATVYSATGIVSATKFCGDGSCLTNVPGFSPDADGNLVAGVCAGCNIASGGENNVVLGTCAGKSLTTADGNVFIGCYAGATYSNEAVGRNVFIGRCAGQCAAINGSQIAFSNVAIGYQALQGKFGQGSGTCHSVAIGDNALRCSSTGRANTAIGEDAGSKTDTGSHNFFGGYKAGTNNTSGVGNVMIGRRAGKNISGEGNVILGAEAACTSFSSNSCTGHYNVIAGYYAANKITGGSNNIVLGFGAGCNMGSVFSNIYIGKSAGQCNTSGNTNIFIGGYAGIGVTSGDYNIAIGKRAALSNGDNQLVIGCCSCNWIVGNANWNVGIGTTNPDLAVGVGNTAKLSVGIVSAYQLYGDGSN